MIAAACHVASTASSSDWPTAAFGIACVVVIGFICWLAARP